MKLGKRLIAICIALIATISLSICAPAMTYAAPTKAKVTTTKAKVTTPKAKVTTPKAKVTATHTKGTVTARAVNVRSGPGKTYRKVGSFKKGTSVTILSRKAGWDKVSSKGTTGYVAAKYIRAK